MALPTFAKQDEIPKGFEGEYEERDGKWHPKDATAELKLEFAAEREKREAAEANAKKAAKALKDLERKGDGATDEQLKKLREDITKEVRAELDEEYKPKLTEAEALKGENRSLKLEGVVKKMWLDANVLPDKVDRLWKLHADEYDLTSEGKPSVKGKATADVTKHSAAIAKQYPEWVSGTKATGGGAAGVTLPAAGGGADQVGKVDPTQRLRAAHEAGVTM